MGKKNSWKRGLKPGKQPVKPVVEEEEDIDLEDQDLELFSEFGKGASFLEDAEFEEYERRPRKELKEDTKLPIKVNGRIVKVQEEPESESEAEESEEEIPVPEQVSQYATVEKAVKKGKQVTEKVEKKPAPSEQKKKPSKSSQKSLATVKEELADIATAILENPEKNHGLLKNLFKYTTDHKSTNLAILTMLMVFKDIIPGYRIRKTTEEENVKVSKQVKELRQFEEGLLSNYQEYLKLLEKSLKTPELQHSCILSLCQLLTTQTHFNFRLNIMTALVKQLKYETELITNAFIDVFKNDASGEASLELVKLLSDYINLNSVKPIVLETFLFLNFNLVTGTDTDTKKRKKETVHLSKKMKKIEKHFKEVQEQVKEAEAVYDRQELQSRQSETLKYVFLTYFRILKNKPTSVLVPTVLEGLSKYTHLINVDFFQDLLNLLKGISNSQYKDYLEGKEVHSSKTALHCIIAAFDLLDTLGGALKVDLRDFYTSLYTQISRLFNLPGQIEVLDRNEVELLLRGIESMLKKNREVPVERVCSFIKRLGTLAATSPVNSALACLNTIKNALTRFPRLECLIDEEGKVSTGIYQPFLDDPNMCNPFATSLWEVTELSRHYHPTVREFTKKILKGDPIKGNKALREYSCFPSEGFRVVPKVLLPKRKFLRIDGPSQYETDFFMQCQDKISDI
ncbi:Nucleolar complex protein 3 [Boothiomyces sp. JEL0838]|nr:Nucleolar complex protein 3 [Boothiomyces sp. JEL0838]